MSHGYSETIVKTYTLLRCPVAVKNKLQHLFWCCCWQVGRGFCPIIGEKGWSRIRRATRIDLMRTWYDCCGTHSCPQQAYSIGTEWPEWSGRESDRDRYGEIIEVRRTDSSLNVRVCGRRWDAETESGKEMDAESKWVSQSIKSTMLSLSLLSIHPWLPPSSNHTYKHCKHRRCCYNHPERCMPSNQFNFMQRCSRL